MTQKFVQSNNIMIKKQIEASESKQKNSKMDLVNSD